MDLTENKLPSLSELLGIKTKIITRVLNRKQIKTNEEFYIIKEEVIDLSSSLKREDKMLLDKALTEFELSKTKE